MRSLVHAQHVSAWTQQVFCSCTLPKHAMKWADDDSVWFSKQPSLPTLSGGAAWKRSPHPFITQLRFSRMLDDEAAVVQLTRVFCPNVSHLQVWNGNLPHRWRDEGKALGRFPTGREPNRAERSPTLSKPRVLATKGSGMLSCHCLRNLHLQLRDEIKPQTERREV